MQIRRIYTGNALRNYDFRLDFPTGEVVIIDPSDMKIVNSLERCDAILLTHDHFDHVVGVEELIDRYDPSIFSHKGVQKYSNKQTFSLEMKSLICLVNLQSFIFQVINQRILVFLMKTIKLLFLAIQYLMVALVTLEMETYMNYLQQLHF